MYQIEAKGIHFKIVLQKSYLKEFGNFFEYILEMYSLKELGSEAPQRNFKIVSKIWTNHVLPNPKYY